MDQFWSSTGWSPRRDSHFHDRKKVGWSFVKVNDREQSEAVIWKHSKQSQMWNLKCLCQFSYATTRAICFFQIPGAFETSFLGKAKLWYNQLCIIDDEFFFFWKNHIWTIYTFSLSDKTVNPNIFCRYLNWCDIVRFPDLHGMMTQAKVLHSRSTWTAEIFCICSCVLVYLYLRICICVKRFQGQATFAFMQRNAKEDSTDC